MAQSLSSTVNWPIARRSVVGAASQIPREFTPEKSGKRIPFRGLKARWPAAVNWPVYHGSLGPIRGTFKSRYFPGLGAPKQRPLLDRQTYTRSGVV